MSDKAEYFGELAQINLCNFKNMQEMIDRMIYLKTGFDNLSEKELAPELMTPLLFKAVSGVSYENTLDSGYGPPKSLTTISKAFSGFIDTFGKLVALILNI